VVNKKFWYHLGGVGGVEGRYITEVNVCIMTTKNHDGHLKNAAIQNGCHHKKRSRSSVTITDFSPSFSK